VRKFEPVINEPQTVKSVGDPLGTKLLTFVLSVIAGSADVIGFLGLGTLFIAHITGNLVILAARYAAGEHASAAHFLSVPVFIIALIAARLLAAKLDRSRIAALRPLLLLQFLLLSGLLAICIGVGSPANPDAAIMIVAAMLGVSAMAIQNALVQISLMDAPSTAVMTTNLTRLVLDLGEVWLGTNRGGRAKAVARARRTGVAIAGFVVGSGLGAWCQAHVGLWSLAVPTGLALVALAITYCPLPLEDKCGSKSHSGSPAFHNPSSYRARSSARR
jgi:uncharacterized membrane protein YoaK (UPF0700 family)